MIGAYVWATLVGNGEPLAANTGELAPDTELGAKADPKTYTQEINYI